MRVGFLQSYLVTEEPGFNFFNGNAKKGIWFWMALFQDADQFPLELKAITFIEINDNQNSLAFLKATSVAL